jgi:hypothetical protein
MLTVPCMVMFSPPSTVIHALLRRGRGGGKRDGVSRARERSRVPWGQIFFFPAALKKTTRKTFDAADGVAPRVDSRRRVRFPPSPARAAAKVVSGLTLRVGCRRTPPEAPAARQSTIVTSSATLARGCCWVLPLCSSSSACSNQHLLHRRWSLSRRRGSSASSR